jgi:signal peptidase II
MKNLNFKLSLVPIMNASKSKFLAAFATVFLVLLIDQCLKVYIKMHFMIGDQHVFTSWFKLHFVENEGMAFGWKLGGNSGKLILSLFRIVAVSFIGFYIYKLIKSKTNTGLIVSMSLIFAGAVGNILDSIFYGKFFSASSPFDLATLFPKGGGYAGFLHGKVVDMLYFPLWEGFLPKWLGGNYVSFFDPVFNIADASISVGVVLILLFQRSFFKENTSQGPLNES